MSQRHWLLHRKHWHWYLDNLIWYCRFDVIHTPMFCKPSDLMLSRVSSLHPVVVSCWSLGYWSLPFLWRGEGVLVPLTAGLLHVSGPLHVSLSLWRTGHVHLMGLAFTIQPTQRNKRISSGTAWGTRSRASPHELRLKALTSVSWRVFLLFVHVQSSDNLHETLGFDLLKV